MGVVPQVRRGSGDDTLRTAIPLRSGFRLV